MQSRFQREKDSIYRYCRRQCVAFFMYISHLANIVPMRVDYSLEQLSFQKRIVLEWAIHRIKMRLTHVPI